MMILGSVLHGVFLVALAPLLAGSLVGIFRATGVDPCLPVFVIIAAIEVGVALAMLPLWRRRRRAAAASGA